MSLRLNVRTFISLVRGNVGASFIYFSENLLQLHVCSVTLNKVCLRPLSRNQYKLNNVVQIYSFSI
jgi:hypothetical protein